MIKTIKRRRKKQAVVVGADLGKARADFLREVLGLTFELELFALALGDALGGTISRDEALVALKVRAAAAFEALR